MVDGSRGRAGFRGLLGKRIRLTDVKGLARKLGDWWGAKTRAPLDLEHLEPRMLLEGPTLALVGPPDVNEAAPYTLSIDVTGATLIDWDLERRSLRAARGDGREPADAQLRA